MRLFCVFAFIVSTTVLADEPKVRVFEGRITDPKGEPLKGAFVEWGFFTNQRDEREIFRSDDQGKYRVETTKVGPDFRLGVSAAGFAPQWVDGLIPQLDPEHTTQDFQLERAIQLRGTVIDEGGEPIAGATVIAQSASTGFYSSFSSPTPSFPFPGPSREDTTDVNGQFVIRNLPATQIIDKPQRGHPFALSIKTPTGRMPRGTAFTNEDNELKVKRSYLVEAKEPPGEIHGKVVDAQSGEPVGQFKLVIRHRPAMIECSDPDGRFQLQGLSVGRRYQVFVYADDYAPFVFRTSARTPGEAGEHQCRMAASPSLRGVVVDTGGRPINDANIVIGVEKSEHNANRFYWGSFKELVDGYMGLETVQRMTTGDDGRFAFSQDKQQGVLGIMAPTYARRFIPVADRAEMMQDGLLRITLEPESKLTGVVRLDGRNEAGASLRLSRVGLWDLDYGSIAADENGRFEIGGLATDAYSLSVYQHSGNMSTVRLSRLITLERGQTLDLTMDSPGGDCTLSGSAQPFALITLSISDPVASGKTDYRHIGTIASAEGRYHFEGLLPGKYKITSQNPSIRYGFHHHAIGGEVEISGDAVHDLNQVILNVNVPAKTTP